MVVLTGLVSWSKKDLEKNLGRKTLSKDKPRLVPGTLHLELSFNLKSLSNAEWGIYLFFFNV